MACAGRSWKPATSTALPLLLRKSAVASTAAAKLCLLLICTAAATDDIVYRGLPAVTQCQLGLASLEQKAGDSIALGTMEKGIRLLGT